MASQVDICNLALAHLGDSATVASIDPPEGSAQAEHCARFYPVALASLLEMHEWKFATRRARLAQLETDSWNWSFAYAYPNGVLRLLAVLPADVSPDAEGHEYDTENQEDGTAMILTDLEDATLRYTVLVTDTTKFPPLFVDALGWLLAAYLAGPVLKGDAGAAEGKRCLAMAQAMINQAKFSDATQRRVKAEHTPDWIEGR